MHKINDKFDWVVCINLPDQPERWEIAKERFRLAGIQVERFDGVRYSGQVNREHVEEGINPHNEAGFSMAHQSVVREAKRRGHANVFLFEDDVVFDPNFNDKMAWLDEVPDEWDMLYLGGLTPGATYFPLRTSPKHVSGHLWQIRACYCTHAVAIAESVFEEILEYNAIASPAIDVYYRDEVQPRGKSYGLMTKDEAYAPTWGMAQQDQDLGSEIREERNLADIHWYVDKEVKPMVTKEGDKIPKVIHQVWLGGKPPEYIERWMDEVKEIHEALGWEYRLWGNAEVQALECVRHFDKCSSYSIASDLVRYEILYGYGGVYLDADFECVNPLDDSFLDGKVWICHEQGISLDLIKSSGYCSCGAIGSVPRSETLSRCLSNMGLADFTKEAHECLGSGFFGKMIGDDVRLLPSVTFFAQQYHNFLQHGPAPKHALDDKARLVHRWDNSWKDDNNERFHLLGDDYYNGTNGFQKDDKQAFEMWLNGAIKGNNQCVKNVAWAYSSGIGCEVDEAEYQKWTARIEKMRKPNFLIIGAQKSGTTWLRKMLQSHSEVWAENEEAHYFDGPDYETRNEEEYLSKFDARTEKMVGEKTPRYMCEPEVMERIFDFNPDVKLIMLLRNPTNRAYSQWRMETRMAIRKGLAELSFTDWVEDNSQLIPNLRPINRGFYIRQIENILSYFPREQLRIEIFERMGQDGYNRICDFMGIEHQPVASSFSQNNYPDMDSDLRVSMDSQFSPFNDELRTFLSDELEEWS